MPRSQVSDKGTGARNGAAVVGVVPKEGGRYSQSLNHGLAILATFSAEHPTLGIAELAGALSMSRSTTHRYATTLVELGYLEQNSSRRYRLTSRAADLGLALLNSMALRERARPLLEDLRARTGRTVSLAILDGERIVLVDRLRGWRGLHEIDLRLGAASRLPLHCTAMGKVLLAALDDAHLRGLLAKLKLERHGPKSRTGKRALRAELERVREQGFAIDDEELVAGLQAIAVPVIDEDGRAIAAVEVELATSAAAAGGVLSAEELHVVLGPTLNATAEAITTAMRGRRRR